MKMSALLLWFIAMAILISAQIIGISLEEHFITPGDVVIMIALLGIAWKVDEREW